MTNKVVYFVDSCDNTKTIIGTLTSSHTDNIIRSKSTIKAISEEIGKVFNFNENIVANKMRISEELAQNGFSFCDEYEFAIEEVPMLN